MATKTLLFALVYVLYLFVPGYFVVRFLNIKRNRYLLSYGISFCLLVLTLMPFLWLGGTITAWLWALHLSCLLTILISILVRKQSLIRFHLTSCNKLSNWPVSCFFVVVILLTFYHLLTGPYTEIPSDFWEHLARVVAANNSINNNYIHPITNNLSLAIFSLDVVHFFHAVIANKFDTNPLELVPSATLATGVIFLGSIYWFSLRLLEPFPMGDAAKTFAGFLAVVFTALSFGTATFSFFRYYAYFPTIFCFPIVFLCTVLLLDYLQTRDNSLWFIVPIPIFLLTITLVHRQETLFTLVLLCGISFLRAIRATSAQSLIPSDLHRRQWGVSLFLISSLALFVCISVVLLEPGPWGYTPHVIGIPNWFPIVSGLPIANPSFRFWDTVGLFGVLVYVCYFAYWSFYRDMDYIIFGMLSPLLTHFNPLFAIFFLHFSSSTTLWRTSYLVPLGMTSSFLIVALYLKYKKTRGVFDGLSFLLISLALVISLLPIEVGNQINRTSRFPSLAPTEAHSGAELWGDLIRKISILKDERQVRGILTDHVTKFVLDSAVFGNIPQRGSLEYFPKHNNDYKSDIKYSDFSHHLLVINKRDGDYTQNALVSGHWPTNILKVSARYPDDIAEFIINNRKNFELLWQQESISIYQIVSFSNR